MATFSKISLKYDEMGYFFPLHEFFPAKTLLGNHALATMKMSDSQYKILNSLGTPNNFTLSNQTQSSTT